MAAHVTYDEFSLMIYFVYEQSVAESVTLEEYSENVDTLTPTAASLHFQGMDAWKQIQGFCIKIFSIKLCSRFSNYRNQFYAEFCGVFWRCSNKAGT